jgi:hypothetical protein
MTSLARFLLGVLGVILLVVALAMWSSAQTRESGETWTCSVDNIGATLTICKASPSSEMKLYITDLIASSTTTTGGGLLLEYGTGTNCGTGTTALLPSSASAVRIGYPPSTSAALVFSPRTPIAVPAGKDLCVLGTATQTVSLQMIGAIRP